MKRETFLVATTAAVLMNVGYASAEVLYRYRDGVLFDGRYGPIAKAQARADAALKSCGKTSAINPDGKFGAGTRKALASLATCPEFSPKLGTDSDARAGAITKTYWDTLVGKPAPSVDDRARTLMLTYEATDYTRMEWNFCQSAPRYNPAGGQPICYSNDPRSYLTWGPNGATAGGGREVQLILRSLDNTAPALIDQSFGDEAAAVRRMFNIPDRDEARSLETYLCGVWSNTGRRDAWKAGFQKIGQQASVRTAFDALYRSASLDGGKITTFYKAYQMNSLVPTEIDYAFFKDRSAHTSPALKPIRKAVAGALASEGNASRWKVRRAIALHVRPSNQRTDRLGRDVTFYMDGAGSALNQEELSAWQSRGKLRASDAGLSDSREYATFSPEPAIQTGIAQPVTLTAAEKEACPAAVPNTRQPKS